MIRYLTDTSEEVIREYYMAFLYNLREYSRIFKCEWVHPRDVIDNEFNRDSRWHVCEDQFLEATKEDRLALARSMLQNGTYWHLQVIEKEDGYHLKDGRHRLWSAKELDKRRQWPVNKKFLCTSETPVRGGHAARMYLPCLVDERFKGGFKEPYYRASDMTNEGSLILLDVPDHLVIQHMVMFPRLLRDALYHNPQIKPSIIVNSEEAWKDFIENDKDPF
jgi:hypothetical protein